MLAKVLSAAIVGLDAIPVEVEVDIASQGLPSFTIVGLPDKAVEEAKERVRAAIRNSGADFPARRITVNLAPADLPKEGPSYDLPIALGILLASGQLSSKIDNMVFAGELSLDGRVRPITGALIHTLLAKKAHMEALFLPEDNANEAAIVPGVTIYPTPNLQALFLHLSGQQKLPEKETLAFIDTESENAFMHDMKDVKGQQQAKRALEIAHAYSYNSRLNLK